MNTSYKGRVIGFILGLIFLNIPGAILFMILGYYFFDRPANIKKQQNDEAVRAFTSNANYNEALVKVTFALMGYVARGAGRVNENHIWRLNPLLVIISVLLTLYWKSRFSWLCLMAFWRTKNTIVLWILL